MIIYTKPTLHDLSPLGFFILIPLCLLFFTTHKVSGRRSTFKTNNECFCLTKCYLTSSKNCLDAKGIGKVFGVKLK